MLQCDDAACGTDIDPGHAFTLLPGLFLLQPFRDVVRAKAASTDAPPVKALATLFHDMEQHASGGKPADIRPLLENLGHSQEGRSWLQPADIVDFFYCLVELVELPINVESCHWCSIDGKPVVAQRKLDVAKFKVKHSIISGRCWIDLGNLVQAAAVARQLYKAACALGRVHAISEVRRICREEQTLNIDETLWVPTGQPPKKEVSHLINLYHGGENSTVSIKDMMHAKRHEVTKLSRGSTKVDYFAVPELAHLRKVWRRLLPTSIDFHEQLSVREGAEYVFINNPSPLSYSTASYVIDETLEIASGASSDSVCTFQLKYASFNFQRNCDGLCGTRAFACVGGDWLNFGGLTDSFHASRKVSKDLVLLQLPGVMPRLLIYEKEGSNVFCLPSPPCKQSATKKHIDDMEPRCVMCFERIASFVMRDCRHLVYCQECRRSVIDYDRKSRGLWYKTKGPSQNLAKKHYDSYEFSCPICRHVSAAVSKDKVRGQLFIP